MRPASTSRPRSPPVRRSPLPRSDRFTSSLAPPPSASARCGVRSPQPLRSFVVRVVLSSRPERGHTADVGTHRPGLASVVATSASRLVLGALIAASCVGWIVNLSSVVGGADSYGYVSAADRVRAARLIQPEPLASVMPFPDGIVAATPLGYVPAGRMANASVPAYPLGLPLLMAGAQTVAGAAGPFCGRADRCGAAARRRRCRRRIVVWQSRDRRCSRRR